MIRYAFTMLELVFVIVLIGVLSAMVIPRMNRDTVYDASEQVLSHIKYTQHLAMTNNVYRSEVKNWHFARWYIRFIEHSTCGVFYKVGSNRNLNPTSGGNPNEDFKPSEAAYDPLTNYPIYNDNFNCDKDKEWFNDVLLTRNYSIGNDQFDMSSCGSKTIAFDYLGRPYFGFKEDEPAGKLLKEDCEIVMEDTNGNKATITITKETGYSYITYN